ncbi:MAG: NTP transferase domain-containing protein, partial [Desulfovibrionaceae bacterium]
MQSIEMAVIPAAGRGTRMRAVSGGGPKELLPVAGEPAIVHALREVGLAKVPKAAVVLRPGKEAVRRAVERHLELCPSSAPEHGLRVCFPIQADQLGECDAVAQARKAAGGGPIAVFYPDNIPRPPGALARLTGTFRRRPCDLVALSRVHDGNRSALSCSGRVELSGHDALDGLPRIRAFLPKGSGPFESRFPNELRTCGVYLALPRYFEFIEMAR